MTDEVAQSRAAEDLFLKLLPAARAIAARFTPPEGGVIGRDDLRQAAALGLWRAVSRFRLEEGTPPLAFAFPFIVGELKRAMASGWEGGGGRRLFSERRRIFEARDRFCQQAGREPTLEELGDLTGLSPVRIAEVSAALAQREDVDAIGTRQMAGPASPEEVTVARLSLAATLADLAPRERRVVALRHLAGLTQDQVARQLGLSQPTVHRLERRGLVHMASVLTRIDHVTHGPGSLGEH